MADPTNTANDPNAPEPEGTPEPAQQMGARSPGSETTGEQARREAQERFESARAQMDEALGKLQGQVQRLDPQQTRRTLVHWVEENPTLSLLLAAGVGMLVGRGVARALLARS